MSANMQRIVVVGGGISGLSAAWEFVQGAPQAQVTVLEGGPRWGGKIATDRVTILDADGREQHFVVDSGPESFITRKPAAWELAQELGLGKDIQDMKSETSNIYVLENDRPELVPMSPVKFVKSGLLTWPGKLRLMAEPFVPPRRDDGDESLADFASRRLGREALEKFLGPILGGIYNTDPERQSVLTTSPVMREMERESGSLVMATLARGRAKARRRKELAARGESLPPSFMAFAEGAQVMIDRLVERLRASGRADLWLESPVQSITREAAGYGVRLESGEVLAADIVLLATPANTAALLLEATAPESAGLLRRIRHASIGTISLIYRDQDLRFGFPISGLMIPRRAHRAIDAVTITSERFRERVPQGYAMARVFFGGSAPHIMALDDRGLLAAVRGELQSMLGITAQPLAWVSHRWPDSYPQADVGHLERVVEIERSLPRGLYVTGSPYRGLGVPDCVGQARETARQALVQAQETLQQVA